MTTLKKKKRIDWKREIEKVRELVMKSTCKFDFLLNSFVLFFNLKNSAWLASWTSVFIFQKNNLMGYMYTFFLFDF
jgi:hypothetical protein